MVGSALGNLIQKQLAGQVLRPELHNSPPPFFSRIEFGWEFRFSQYREPLSSPVRRCTGFYYQLIRVEASGSRDQPHAQALWPSPSTGSL